MVVVAADTKRVRGARELFIEKNVFSENGSWCVTLSAGRAANIHPPLRYALKSKRKHVRRIADNEHKQSA